MASTTVNPTRMELTRLKKRLVTARRGHKLLKDKRDELMRQFFDIVRRNRELRARVEEGLTQAYAGMKVASAVMSSDFLEQALLYPSQSVSLTMDYKNVIISNGRTITRETSSHTVMPRLQASWMTPSQHFQISLRRCSNWRRSKRPCS